LSCQQCHRSSPIQNGKTPDTGFFDGKIAIMLNGEWQTNLNTLSHEEFQANYGVAPFPPPATHPDRASTAVVRGPVVIIPAGALDKEEAVQLLAWMMSPEILADAAYANALLPSSQASAQDPRFQRTPHFETLLDLLAHPNARATIATPISPELNEALAEAEQELLHEGGDPVPLLNKVQAKLAEKLKETLAGYGRP
jgi:ABC-type glycerol-3-phosphate transport system substrate-binding protein